MIPNLGNLPIDIAKLIETRMMLVANSGGGKSWALRRVLEQTAAHVQQLVIDPEGEFASLREKFDYIICAPQGADAVANPQTAAALASALWKAGTSAILDISELKAHERVLFVRRFLETLLSMPRQYWHSTLVVLDEAQLFCPQNGSVESSQAVIDVATRGRKRGLCLLAATLRVSSLNKDVAAETLNKMIGRTGLDIDVKRAADDLGMNIKEATPLLRNLEPGEFFVYGPALSRAVLKTTIGAISTSHGKSGKNALAAPPPASAKVRAQLAKIEGLKRDAETEAQTVAELKAELTKLRKEFAQSSVAKPAPGVSEAEVRRRIDEAVANVPFIAPNPVISPALVAGIDQIAAGIKSALAELSAAGAREMPRVARVLPRLPTVNAGAVAPTPSAAPAPAQAPAPVATGMTGPEQRIIDAIAWLEALGIEDAEQPAVAFLAGYSFGGGAFNNPKGRLNQRRLVEYRPQGCIRLTDAGRAVANPPPPVAGNDDLHERVLARLGGPEQRLLRPLLASYPNAMSNADLAAAANYTAGAGAFNNPRGRLRTLGLIEYPQPGQVIARALLFPKGHP